jgi:hypothetical protein
MAIASTERERRLIHRACNSAKSSLIEIPLALTDYIRKESLVLFSKGSPLCSFGGDHRGGGRDGGVPPGGVAGSSGIVAGSAATKETWKNVCQVSFSRPGFMEGLGRAVPSGGPRTLAEATDGSEVNEGSSEWVEDRDMGERALSTDDSSSRDGKWLVGSFSVSNESREEDSLGWPI